MTNQELYEEAMESITILFSDISVSSEITIENLAALRDEIQIMIDGLNPNHD